MKEKHNRQLHKGSGKGFTLAEMLITVAIVLVLLAIGMVALTHYVKAMKLTEMDNSAKDIFIAAQNHLKAADVSGRIASYMQVEPDAAGKHITEYKPDDYDKNLETPDFANDYYYLIYTPDNRNDSLEDSLLSCMLPFASIENEMRTKGSYVIEYDPNTADVYGVFFTDDFDESDDLNINDIKKITEAKGRHYNDEGRKIRKNYAKGVVGYYGGAMADKLMVEALRPLTVKAENKDVLTIKVTDPNYFVTTGMPDSSVNNNPFAPPTIEDGGSGEMLETNIILTVTGDVSKKTKILKFPLQGTSTEPQADTESTESTIPYWSVEKVTDSNGESLLYEITLDDITQRETHFCNLFPEFVPGEDLNITVTASSSKVLTDIPEAKLCVNSLFERVIVGQDDNGNTVVTDSATANISCSRHLQNLDGAVSNVARTGHANGSTYLIKYVSLTEDIDWQTYFGKKGDKKAVTSYAANNVQMANPQKGTFYSLMRSDLSSFNGHGHTIKNIVIDNKVTAAGSSRQNNGGLFRAIGARSKTFVFSNLILKDFDIKAYNNVGVLFAETDNDSIQEFTVDNIIVDGGTVSSTSVSASAAGLFGYCRAANLSVTNCAATVKASNTGQGITAKASGFIGKINGNNIVISDCYSGGYTNKGEYDVSDYNASAPYGYAGGFIACTGGSCKIDINHCFNACSVKGKYAGGFIGHREGTGAATIRNSYTVAAVSATDANRGGTFIGSGISGMSTANTKITESYYLTGINDSALKAYGTLNTDGGAAAKNYNELKGIFAANTTDVHSATEHEGLDTTLDGKIYPFKSFTTEVQKDDDNTIASPIYYGDWPKHKIISGTCMIAYRETMSNGNVRWSTLGAEAEGTNLVIDKLPNDNDLNRSRGLYAVSHEYGFLAKTPLSKNKDFLNNSAIDSCIDFNSYSTVAIDGEQYYYYRFKSSITDGTDTVTLPQWSIGDTGTNRVTFKFNPAYANSMAANQGTLKYEIRTTSQLEKVSANPSFVYGQTCDINLQLPSAKTYSEPVVKEIFSGTYTSEDINGESYRITGFVQTVTTDKKLGLFEQISGKVSNLAVEGTVNDNFVSTLVNKDVGILTGRCTGEITNCSVRGTINVNARGADHSNVGILAGSVEDGSGGNAAKIDSCYAIGTINIDLPVSDTTVKVNTGGLIGNSAAANTMKASISNSYAITDYQNAHPAVQPSLLIGSSSNTTIVYCHAALQHKNGAGEYGLKASDAPFITGSDNTLKGCYGLTSDTSLEPPINGFNRISSAADYTDTNSFGSLDATIWLKVHGGYPTLKSNPE